MRTEYEAKFLDIDVAALRAKLAALGAVRTRPETLMRRAVFHPPVPIPGAWAHARDEEDKITMSIKQVTGAGIEDQREAELVIHDFEAGREFLRSLGAREKAYQETRRESWILDGVKIDIDTWPGLPTYAEVEADSEKLVRDMADRLGYDYSQAVFGASAAVYERTLGIPRHILNDHTPEITFERPPMRRDADGAVSLRTPRIGPYPCLVIAYFALSAFVLAFVKFDYPVGASEVLVPMLGPTVGLAYKESLLGVLAYVFFTAVYLSFLLIPFELRSHTGRIVAFVCLGFAWLLLGFFTNGVAYYR